MTKRKHQVQFESAIQEIIDGDPVTDILVKVTPGGGKSSLPIIAGRLIKAGLADGICWVCPRMSLQDQAERNFIDPFFRRLFDHQLTIRSSTNEINPCRGTNGFVTTYQALGVDRGSVEREFRRKRYILILDEYHHAEEEGDWTKALFPLYELAAFRILMTGTLERGDRRRIAFTRYCRTGMDFVPILEADEHTRVIEYSRTDALMDRAILPLSFIFLDGEATWEKRSGRVVEARLSDAKDLSQALYTALHTEYARELLQATVDHWRKNSRGKLLVVAAKIKNAKEYLSYMRDIGINARIATSEDDKGARVAIKSFKAGRLDALVTVAMAYEGLDVPSISHIACLTNIRSAPWIEQMAARANRIDPHAEPFESQRGYVFAPSDPLFREIVSKIEAEQTLPATIIPREEKQEREGNGGEGGGVERTPGGIKPLTSRVLDFELTCQDMRHPTLPVYEEIKTSKETERDLLAAIDKHIREYAFNNRFNPHKLNAELYDYFKKPRRHMTVPELEKVLGHVRAAYPLNIVRGTGHKRVPTKAVRIEASQWRP